MAYLVIESFKGGVDRRRPIYASKPGTLWTCENAHISMGGDIEQRKAFVDRGGFSADTFGLVAVGESLYTFGSSAPGAVTVPSGVIYQQFVYPGAAMTKYIDHDLFDGLIYVIAQFGDGSVQHFYDGVLVAAWNDGIVRSYMGNLTGMATALAALIDASVNYVALAAAQVITVTAATAGVPFTASPFAENGGATDDETMVAATVTPNVVGVTSASSSFTFSVRGGPGAGALGGLLVGGVAVISVGVNWATSDTVFAAAIATQINTDVSAPDYTATSSGAEVTVTAAVVGPTANGLEVLATTTGTARAGTQAAAGSDAIGSMAGGATAVVAVAQVVTLTLGGTFDPGDRFGATMTSGTNPAVVEYFGNVAKPFGNAMCVKTHKRKMYVGAGSLLFFSKVNDPTAWNSDVDAGAGFINAANHVGGSEVVRSLENYQGRLAVISRRVIQLWTMQNDDALNVLDQTLLNTGTRASRSTLEFAGNDVFYLDDIGIRSIKARDASNNAFASGVGAAINKLAREWMRDSASEADIVGAVVVVDPEEGRFWLVIGTRVFVYSYFPDTGIAAWSWYTPGFTITDLARTTNKVWARGDDNTLYLYGGDSGTVYDASPVEVQMPFTSAEKPGTFKNYGGMDIAAEGAWACVWKINPNNMADPGVQMGTYDGVTFPKANWCGVGHSTHIAPLLTRAQASYGNLSQVAIYYQGAEESA